MLRLVDFGAGDGMQRREKVGVEGESGGLLLAAVDRFRRPVRAYRRRSAGPITVPEGIHKRGDTISALNAVFEVDQRR